MKKKFGPVQKRKLEARKIQELRRIKEEQVAKVRKESKE